MKKVEAAATVTTKVKQLPKRDQLLKQIQHFNVMARQVKNRARFVETLNHLSEVDLNESKNSTTFEDVENYKLVLKSGYSTEVLSISNSFILDRFLDFIKKEIQTKIDDLDKVILA